MTELDLFTVKITIADTIRQQVRENLDYVLEALRIYKFIIERLVDRVQEDMWRAERAKKEANEQYMREIAKRFYQHYSKVLTYDPIITLHKTLEFVGRTRNQLWSLAREIENTKDVEKLKRLWEEVKKTIYEYVNKDIDMPGIKLSQELIKIVLWLDEDVKSF